MPVRFAFAPALAGALTLGAGLAHAAAAVDHAGDQTGMVVFLLVAATQAVLGLAVVFRPLPQALVGGAAVNAAAAVAWTVSRTAGLPPVLGLGGREPVEAADLATTVAELAAVVATVVAFRIATVGRPRWLSPVLLLAAVPALVGMAAPSTHGPR